MRGLKDFRDKLNRYGHTARPCFFLVDFEMESPRLWAVDELKEGEIQFSFSGTRSHAEPSHSSYATPELRPLHIGYDEYLPTFETIRRGLARGNSFLTNLTCRTPVELSGALEDIYRVANAPYRVLLRNRFVCFSPETFVTIGAGGLIQTRPMKGTSPATPEGRERLLTSPKEIAEHTTIVDLLRNDLSRVARGVTVERFRYLERIETAGGALLQSSSLISGRVGETWPQRLGDIFLGLLPAGSVSGAPKAATVELIRAAEGRPRGYYCGVAGYFDGRSLDSCVLIRFIERDAEGRHYFRSGGGITALSRPEDEYDEMRAKVRLPIVAARPILRPSP